WKPVSRTPAPNRQNRRSRPRWLPDFLVGGFHRAMIPRYCRFSKSVSACVRVTSIQLTIRACLGTLAERSARSCSIMVCTLFQTRTRIFSVRSDSTFTRCVLQPVNCGAKPLRRVTSYMSTCGMTTLSESESKLNLDGPVFAHIPRDENGPVFAEPWQAQAFAMDVKLSEEGHFTWKEWAATLADELKAAADRGDPDDGSHYYEHWLAA